MNFDEVRAHFPDAKLNGNGWKARCPAHLDKVASLSLKPGEDGRTLIHCHAGCDVKDVLQRVNLTLSDLQPPMTSQPSRQIVATYDYRDEAGRLLYQAVRYVPKDFKQRRPDGNDWSWSIQGVRHVLYHTPELAAADPAEPVIIGEGEKDVDAAIQRGFVATTNHGGAGKWRREYSEQLRGRHVVIIPDNDDAGRKHAEKVTESLSEIAASVITVDLPGLPPKGDLSDFFNRGGTAEQLRELIAEARSTRVAFPLTDLGNAERFVWQHGKDVRYVFTHRRFYVWDGKRWRHDETGEVERRAKQTARSIYAEAAKIDDDERRREAIAHARSLESAAKIRAMIELVRSEPSIPITPAELDHDPMLLTVANGTLDLRTCDLRAHRREDLITKLAPVVYDHKATCTTWLAFLDRIFAGKERLTAFIRRAIGYSLTGDTSERCVFILFGAGSNGKTTLLKVIMALLGDYALRTPTQTLMAKRGDSIPNDIARLKGARFISASETEENARLAESTIKDLAGNDIISARFMRGEWFDFTLEGKIWLATNHKPIIRGTDRAIWDRIRLIPFTVRIEDSEKDPHLFDKLCRELPGILAWTLEGCREWQRDGLGIPEEVAEATENYRAEMDSLAAFIDECCTVSRSAEAGATDLYKAYRAWAEATGDRVISQKAFGMQLAERGFEGGGRGAGGRKVWRGIGLVNHLNDSEPSFGINAKKLSHGALSENTVHNRSNGSLDDLTDEEYYALEESDRGKYGYFSPGREYVREGGTR